MTILQTTDYDMFKFRDDNRFKLERGHMNRIKRSIQEKNMLDIRPIIVNENMEIIDGQNRLLAAKSLGVPIYYQIEKNLNILDMVRLNNSKSWGTQDYMNFWIKQGNQEYIKLRNFLEKNNLTLRVGMHLIVSRSRENGEKFKNGEFVFPEDNTMSTDIIWETIDYIKKMNGCTQPYLDSNRFWKALIKITSHENFDVEQWRLNFHKLYDRISIRPTYDDYVKTFAYIYNYKQHNKIDFLNKEESIIE